MREPSQNQIQLPGLATHRVQPSHGSAFHESCLWLRWAHRSSAVMGLAQQGWLRLQRAASAASEATAGLTIKPRS